MKIFFIMGCLYIVCMYSLPLLIIVSFFVGGWEKFWVISAIMTISGIVLFFKTGWYLSWKETKKHGVKVSNLSALGPSPVHAIITILAIFGYFYSWIWMLLDSRSTERIVINTIGPLFLLFAIILYYWKIKK